MFLLRLVFLIVLLPTYETIECFTRASFFLTLSSRTFDMIEKVLQFQDTMDKFYCSAVLRIDTANQALMLDLDQTLLRTDVFDSAYDHTYVVSMFAFPKSTNDKDKLLTITEINFRCSNTNRCDYPLILKYIRWILHETHRNLIDAIQPIFPVYENRKMECALGATLKAEKCNGTACLWRFWDDDKTMKRECRTDHFSSHVVLILQVQSIKVDLGNSIDESFNDQHYVTRAIDLWCDLNNCNNEEATQKLTEAAHKHYAFWSLLKNDLSDKESETEIATADLIDSTQTNGLNHELSSKLSTKTNVLDDENNAHLPTTVTLTKRHPDDLVTQNKETSLEFEFAERELNRSSFVRCSKLMLLFISIFLF